MYFDGSHRALDSSGTVSAFGIALKAAYSNVSYFAMNLTGLPYLALGVDRLANVGSSVLAMPRRYVL